MSAKLSRRTMLGGTAALIGLPLLEAMLERRAHGEEEASPLRLICYYVPNGMLEPDWRPTGTGPDYALSQTLAPLAGLEDRLLVISGLANHPATPVDGPGGHASGTSGLLTCTQIDRSEDRIRAGISMDQVFAQHIGAASFMPSLQLGVEGGDALGHCVNGYACAYFRTISWAGPTRPLPKVVSPAVVFDLLFAGADPRATQAERARRRAHRHSVLDHAARDARRLQQDLGARDRAKLDEYLTGVRELELRIDAQPPQCDVGEVELDAAGVADRARLMADLIVLALRCDATRVVSFMLANSASTRSYEFIGVPDAHHDLSHHAGNLDKVALLQQIERWEIEQLAYLLQRMDEVDEVDGTLLDRSVVFFSSEVSSGNSHTHMNLPVLVAGGSGAGLATGQHLHFDHEPPLANLYIALLQGLGVPIDAFGDDGTGPLPGIFAPRRAIGT